MVCELSYVISTYNRLSFLKILLSKLIEEVRENEEIVVVDGGSTDGTRAFLEDLFNKGFIHQYISERDKNQAHGWNKALLIAKGSIIKKIIDDDVFDFTSIRKCANYMIAHPEVDVIISNDLSAKLDNPTLITRNTRLGQYKSWATNQTQSFTFGDVHMLIKRSSLAIIGLYNTGYVMIDWEYSLRISHLRANIVYYTGYNALSVFQEQSVSGLMKKDQITAQSKRAMAFYEYAGDDAEITLWSKIKIAVGKRIFSQAPSTASHERIDNISQIYEQLYKEIDLINKAVKFEFIKIADLSEAKG
ncbi:glycosyltransferase [Pedobacter sp. PF22-3]|uniref:glycosyltransferase n=1 Tax=Pedobacter sp. PF22-3 TaxID=2994467 RepID=UPI0022479EB8|nr:glycosyltransferase [Pedobacter sp. PF22-3]MCX2492580.1 glycosyltransferase [Pedobacter sp. PF22-3]